LELSLALDWGQELGLEYGLELALVLEWGAGVGVDVRVFRGVFTRCPSE
jgi:hypothetical protein